MSTLVRTRPCGAFYRGLLSTSRNLNISQLGCAALGIRPVNRRPKRAHPHCLLKTLADKLFLALRWAPFGRRSALNRSPPILVKWQAFQVLRYRRWVGPLWTLIYSLKLVSAYSGMSWGRTGTRNPPGCLGRVGADGLLPDARTLLRL